MTAIESQGDLAYLVSSTARRIGPFHLVIDASGARSKLKHYAQQKTCVPKSLVYGAFWASLRASDDTLGNTTLTQRYQQAKTMIGVLPIGKPNPGMPAMSAFFWSTKPDNVDALVNAGIQSWKDQVWALWPECEPYLQQINGFEDMTLARYSHHTLQRPYGRNLAIIGDAAHSTSPQLGQGANMALLDARALSHALATSLDVPSALQHYAASRRLHVKTFQALSAAFTPFYQSDSNVLPFFRDKVVASILRIPPAPQILASMVSGTLVDPFKSIGLTEKVWI
jgi:2-polyprenyl-6-methoxyphenol hydroxylase-like FAD-dependent oxidoreductase